MKIFDSACKAGNFLKNGSAITIGNYDGVHIGHRFILERLRNEAGKRGLPAVVYTFEPHPVKLLAPSAAPPTINTLKQKMELLAGCGVSAVVVEKFTRRFSHHSPKDFFRKFIVSCLHAKFIMVGYDFTFGAKRQGNIETLEKLGMNHGIGVNIVKPRLYKDTLVSSTLVREYVLDGRIKEVMPLLGRPFFINGRVVAGSKRGAKLGIPTANMETENELIPKKGVYITRVVLGGKKYRGVTNIGTKPTFGGNCLSIETHIPGFNKKIYGKKCRLIFLKRIRNEKRFETSDELVRQIRMDIKNARHHEKTTT